MSGVDWHGVFDIPAQERVPQLCEWCSGRGWLDDLDNDGATVACPECPTVERLLAIGAAVWTAKRRTLSSWMHPEDREQALTFNETIAHFKAVTP